MMLNRFACDGRPVELDWVQADGLGHEPWAIWDMEDHWYVAMNGDMLSRIHATLRLYVTDNETMFSMAHAMVVDVVNNFIAAKADQLDSPGEV